METDTVKTVEKIILEIFDKFMGKSEAIDRELTSLAVSLLAIKEGIG